MLPVFARAFLQQPTIAEIGSVKTKERFSEAPVVLYTIIMHFYFSVLVVLYFQRVSMHLVAGTM